jgi:parallel beta-helix repeat protein
VYLRLSVLVFGLACLALGGSAAARAQAQPQQCPVVVSNTVLKTDCIGPMIVAGSNLTVNLGTHQVTCNGDPTRTGIVVENQERVQITNGHVHGCGSGILLRFGREHNLTNLHVDHNVCCSPFTGGSGSGIRLEFVSDSAISGSYVADNAGQGVTLHDSDRNRLVAGMVVVRNDNHGVIIDAGSNDNIVHGSEISGNVATGIQVNFSSRNTVESNSVNDQELGVHIGGESAANVVRGNEIRRNSGIGVFLNGSNGLVTGNLIQANKITDNAFFGGIRLSSGFVVANTVAANDLRRHRFGIVLEATASNNLIRDNVSLENTVFDMEDDNPNCDANLWIDNTFVTANQPQCIH